MTSEINVAEILAHIKAQIDQRRLAGDYPPGLENQLELEFTRIINSTNRRYSVSVALAGQLEYTRSLLQNLTGVTPTQSKIPGGALIHKILALITKRQVRGLASQVRDVDFNILVCLQMFADFAQAQEDADRRLVSELSKHILERLAVVDHLALITTELEMRVKQIDARLESS